MASETEFLALSASRTKALGKVQMLMDAIRTLLTDKGQTTPDKMAALLTSLVAAKEEFTRAHNKVTDDLSPTSNDAIDLHQHADGVETEVTAAYEAGLVFIAALHDPGDPDQGTKPAETSTKSKDRKTSERGRSRERSHGDLKATNRSISEIKDLLRKRHSEFDRLDEDCRSKQRSIDFLEEQRQTEREEHQDQVRGLEDELDDLRQRLRRLSSTPAHEPDARGVTFNNGNLSSVIVVDNANVHDTVNAQHISPGSQKSDPTIVNVKAGRGDPGVKNSSRYSTIVDSGSVPISGNLDASLIQNLISQNNDLVETFIETNKSQSELLTEAHEIPKTKLVIFDGNPLNYWLFVKNFDDLIGNSNSIRPAKKLNTLIQYCAPEVQKVISGCQLMTAEAGYSKAKALFRAKFGNPFIISQAWKSRLSEYPRVTTPALLQAYSQDLTCCFHTMSEMGYLADLESVDSICTITSKLSNHLRAKWRKVQRNALEKGKVGTLKDIVDIVNTAAEETNDPIYNDDRLDQLLSSYSAAPISKIVNTTLTTTKPHNTGVYFTHDVDNSELDTADCKNFDEQISIMASDFRTRACVICGGGHYTSDCPTFLKGTPVERLAMAREHKLCLLCLSKDHFIRRCTKKWQCQVQGCFFRHHTTLHGAFGSSEGASAAKTAEVSGSGKGFTPEIHTQALIYKTITIRFAALPTAPIICTGNLGNVQSHALLDSASNTTIVTAKLIRQLGCVKKGTATLKINTISGARVCTGGIYDFRIRGIDGQLSLPVFDAVAIDELPISGDNILSAEDVVSWSHLSVVSLPHVEAKQVDILVGQDNAHLLKPGERIDGPGMRDPFAVETPLGWTVYGFRGGRVDQEDAKGVQINLTSIGPSHEPVSLEETVNRFWDLDQVPKASVLSNLDKGVISYWDKNIKIIDGHIQVPIPFKDKPPNFPYNRDAALHRLKALGDRLKRDRDLQKMYVTAMNVNFERGFAERCVDPPLPGFGWYVTHFGVKHKRKPGVVRPVMNGKFKCRGTSLNDKVLQGPDLNNKLVDVLVNFRIGEVAFTTDVQAMFNMVLVPEEQRDCMRFLWWVDGNPENEVIDCRMTRHMFGGVWSPSATTYAMQALITLLGLDPESEVAKTILRSFYVDDCLKAVNGIVKAINLLLELFHVLERVSFSLAKVASNKIEVVNAVPEEARAKGMVSLELDGGKEHIEHSLGQGWRPAEDMFVFLVSFDLTPETRRQMLSTLSSLFDPLGLCGPFLIPAKRLLQELTKRSIGWDDPVPRDIADQWSRWASDAKELEKLTIPRWVGFRGDGEDLQLHHYSDASELAYGVVSYLCVVNASKRITVSTIIMSRCKLRPVKVQSIPRLELCGALMAAESDEILHEYIDAALLKSQFWTDSALVLRYLMGEPSDFKTFVANRVGAIQRVTNIDQWHHIPGELNPADLISRGMTAAEIVASDRWKYGPEFILRPAEGWPSQPNFMTHQVPQDEIKKERQIYKIQVDQSTEDTPTINPLLSQFLAVSSDWIQLLRLCARVVKACSLFRAGKDKSHNYVKETTAEDILEARDKIIALTQGSYLSKRQTSGRAFAKFFPKSINGLLCVGGRLARGSFPVEFSHPAILPANNPVTQLFITHCHDNVLHGGVERTLLETRKSTWIIGGRKTVGPVVRACKICRRYKSKPCQQRMADLPSYRITPKNPPFTSVGIDYFGPLYVKIGRSQVKRYACTIICSATTAVHIEMADDLTTSSFINALVRFIARRGKPRHILSDNGTNFVGAKAELEKSEVFWGKEEVSRYCMDRGISWKFNPPAASHFGGIWERQIRSLRSLIVSSVHGKVLSEEATRTFLCLAEQVHNSRPLTRLTEDPEDGSPLTPSHLLNLRCTDNIHGVFFSKDLVKKSWRQAQHLADVFWAKWVAQYLTGLQKRKKWVKDFPNLKKGDLVLILQENTPRFEWPLGIVQKAHAGHDGLVRSVDVRTQSGVYTRPVVKIVLLEGDCKDI